MIAAIRAARVPLRVSVALPKKGKVWPLIGVSKAPNAKVNWADSIGRIASQGDREAFKLLFAHFAPRIKGFMLNAGCTADQAEEIAQNTLIAVWRKAGQFDPATAGAAAWIFTIARNLRIDSLRRTVRIGSVIDDAALAELSDPADSADVVMSRLEDTSRVKAAIGRLSDEQSTVIRLSFLEERPHPEIASLLGIPLGTVKSRIRLALNRLREFLDEEP